MLAYVFTDFLLCSFYRSKIGDICIVPVASMVAHFIASQILPLYYMYYYCFTVTYNMHHGNNVVYVPCTQTFLPSFSLAAVGRKAGVGQYGYKATCPFFVHILHSQKKCSRPRSALWGAVCAAMAIGVDYFLMTAQ